jgi:hypothetical protein
VTYYVMSTGLANGEDFIWLELQKFTELTSALDEANGVNSPVEPSRAYVFLDVQKLASEAIATLDNIAHCYDLKANKKKKYTTALRAWLVGKQEDLLMINPEDDGFEQKNTMF